MNKTFYPLLATIVFVMSLLTACTASLAPSVSPATSPSEPTTTEPISLKVGTLPYISNVIMKIAEEEGYFAEQGLDVELLVQASANDFVPLLLQGELDVATPALSAGFFNAVTNGGNIKFVLPLTSFTVQDCASIGILARQSDIDARRFVTPDKWKDAKLVVSMVGVQAIPGYVLDKALNQGGLTLQDVTVTPLDLPAQAAALTSGQADLVYAVEPWVTRMETDPAIGLLMPAEPFLPDLTASLIAYGAKPLADPAIGERFAVAYLKAVRQYSQGKTPRNVEIAAAYTQLDPALIEQICWSSSPIDGAMNIDSIMGYQAWLKDQGLLDEIVPADKLIDTHFVEVANQQLGEATP